MHLLVSKIELDDEDGLLDRRDAKQITLKISQKFKVICKPLEKSETTNYLVVSCLGYSHENLNKKIDEICEYIEVSGYSRVTGESTFLDHIDNLFDASFEE
ncbi:MAG: hypothetical protein HRU19_10915 [Pseudobacteriovorax sp.]|nr:hypothetical protein [Pseudobacteriovorax sp.]